MRREGSLHWTFVMLLLGALGSTAAAQDATTQPANGPATPVSDARSPASATSQPALPSEGSQADPTRPADRLRPFLNPGAGSPARAAKETVHFPRIQKRGFIEADGAKPEALIEIEGGSLHSIQEGSTLTISTSQGSLFTFRVTKLSPDEIEIECEAPEGPSKGQKLIIR